MRNDEWLYYGITSLKVHNNNYYCELSMRSIIENALIIIANIVSSLM